MFSSNFEYNRQLILFFRSPISELANYVSRVCLSLSLPPLSLSWFRRINHFYRHQYTYFRVPRYGCDAFRDVVPVTICHQIEYNSPSNVCVILSSKGKTHETRTNFPLPPTKISPQTYKVHRSTTQRGILSVKNVTPVANDCIETKLLLICA